MKAQAINTRVIDFNTARTQATARPSGLPTLASGMLAQARGLEILAKLATRLALALMPALAIVALATLAIANPGTAVILQAALWAGGFLYLALAAESDKSGRAALNLGLGVTVQTLAWLSVEVAPELAVAAAVLVAARMAVAIFRRT
jgi:apolipoprotein N-acyltransferase